MIGHKLGVLSLIALCSTRVSCQNNKRNHNQNITTNNGISVQVNVEQTLRQAAKLSDIDERGWMRVLVPADKPSPAIPSKCDTMLSQDARSKYPLKVFLGEHNFSQCSGPSCTVIAAGTASGDLSKIYPLLSVKRVGSVYLLNTEVYDTSGNIIVNIEEDKPHLNTNFVSDWTRPDKSTLAVIDNHNDRVLYVRLLNDGALYIEGIFNLPDKARSTGVKHPILTISKDELSMGHHHFINSCSGEATLAAFVFSD